MCYILAVINIIITVWFIIYGIKSHKLEYRNQAKTRDVKIDHLATLKIVIENDEIMIVSAQNPCGTEIPKDKIEIERL
jgi:putative Mn2+ efflux pump MntP